MSGSQQEGKTEREAIDAAWRAGPGDYMTQGGAFKAGWIAARMHYGDLIREADDEWLLSDWLDVP